MLVVERERWVRALKIYIEQSVKISSLHMFRKKGKPIELLEARFPSPLYLVCVLSWSGKKEKLQ
jgi:hypothetical protein